MKKELMRMIAAVAAVLLVSCGEHNKYVLFENGNSEYSIVVDPSAGESVQLAAVELQTWVEKVSGVTLPIVAPDGGAEGKRLVVGWNEVSASLLPDEEEPAASDDAVNWRSVRGDLVFWGGAKRGTLYSVYSFLEEELGCRWYSSKVSVAPGCARYAFKKISHREVPSIIVRDDLYYDVVNNPLFSGRLRNNHVPLQGRDGKLIPFSSERFWGVHTFDMMVPQSAYFKSHPEYYSLRDGKRQKGSTQLCLSKPDVLRITIESMRKVMRKNPDYLIYSLTQNDNFDYCECSECQAIADQYGGQSGLMIWFVNQVADALKEEFPDKYIGTFAYQYTRGVPKDIKPRENVVVRLCSIECCLIHNYDECEQNRAFLEDLQGWSAISPHLYIWDYTTAFTQYSLPVPNFRTAKPHIQDFVANKTIGMMEEGDYQTKCGEFNELKAYLLAKLMWNCEADTDAIIKDFTDGYYGPAGEFIREYIDFADRELRRPGFHMNCYPVLMDEVYSEKFIREATAIFARAKAAVAGSREYLERVESAEFPILLLRNEKMPLQSFDDGTYGSIRRIIDRDGIDRMSEAWQYDDRNCRLYLTGESYLARHDEQFALAGENPWPAVASKCGEEGVSYAYYEGDFTTTGKMLRKGKLIEKGTMPQIAIPADSLKDHFGYEFKGLFKAEATGKYMFIVKSDDGAVLYIDGRKVIDVDGSHSESLRKIVVPLAVGYHDVRILYFEDCEDQVLEVTVRDSSSEPKPLKLYQPK
ncbi:MAG: DUF4838 domain-containing protein [Bacteroidales bacterium]|nr:DUF4838 domain-containing protein [Candidatus Cacconaster scatequi]